MPNGSVGDELSRIAQWLTTKLSGDTTITTALHDGANGVHFSRRTPKSGVPAVVFNFQGGTDIRGAGPLRLGVNGVWIVKAVVAGRDVLAAKPIADRIDVLLQASSGTADGADIFSCVRDAPFYMDEHDADTKQDFIHLGGRYRILAQRIPA